MAHDRVSFVRDAMARQSLTESEVAAQMRALVAPDDRSRSDLKALGIGEEIA